MTTKQTEAHLHARGFDLSTGRRVRCSQCEAVAINGIACHETGCPNTTAECVECGAPIPAGHRCCAECAD